MATTNLTSASIGSIVISMGNGAPDHAPADYSIYMNRDTHTLHAHIGGGKWVMLKTSEYGEIYTSENTATVGVAAQNTWYSTANAYTWYVSAQCGAYMNNNKMQYKYPGLYRVCFSASVEYSAAITAVIEANLIKNENTSSVLAHATTLLDSTDLTVANVYACAIVRVAKDDRHEIVVRNTTNSTDFKLKHAYINAVKIAD